MRLLSDTKFEFPPHRLCFLHLVDGEHRDFKEVVRDFLAAKKL
jgi:hypothetical protein